MSEQSKIEKIYWYIKRTAIPPRVRARYDVYPDELIAIFQSSKSVYDALSFAFAFGLSRGYRAGKKAVANG